MERNVANDKTDGGNGNKLILAVQETKIDMILDILKRIDFRLDKEEAECNKRHDEIDQGILEREKKLAVNASQTRWQWGAIVGVASGFSAWVGYLTRLIVDHIRNGG